MGQIIDSKLLAILFLMNEVNRLKNNFAEIELPIVIEEENAIEEVKSEVELKYHLAFNDIKTKEDAIRYEQALSDYVSYILNEENNLYNEDEIRLMKKSISIDSTSLKDYNFIYSDHIPDILRGVKISTTGINGWLKNPDYIELFESNGVKNFLCTKHVKLLNKGEYIVFYHASKRDNLKQNDIELLSLFFIHYAQFADMLNNPVRLFLFLLDNYGLEIECDGKKSRFVIEASSEKLQMQMSHKGRSYGQMQGKKILSSPNDKVNNIIIFSYGIDLDKYLNDFNHRMI